MLPQSRHFVPRMHWSAEYQESPDRARPADRVVTFAHTTLWGTSPGSGELAARAWTCSKDSVGLRGELDDNRVSI